MISVSDIRKTFLSYFDRNDHKIINSSSLVPYNDPSLMFVNSGMVQFKNIFTGNEVRDYNKAVTSQKCVRAGGKHNDLENVGHTARHHTFFEMLGNFSFGDYFKEKAIFYAWDLLTNEFRFPKDKLLVTYYHEDDEAKILWKKISGLDDNKIIPINTSDNFWSMGDRGPCGPCSEIFYDHGDSIFGGPPGSKDEDGDRFIEIWNLVFMQYEQISDNERIKLPKPSIDTGMGLERLAAVLQGKHDNYDIDLFQKLIVSSAEKSSTEINGKFNVSHRVIIDHLRSCSFLIADGVLPSNDGRGYVLRRIMRRGMRHAHIIGCKDPLIYKLVPSLIETMGDAFPELIYAKDLITNTLENEEIKFKETLDRGMKILDQETERLTENQSLDGKVAFKLYDTYGFPLDLTQDILKSKNIDVNTEEFDKEMEKQKLIARSSWKGSGDSSDDKFYLELENLHEPTTFIGYKNLNCFSNIICIIDSNKFVNEVSEGCKVTILLDTTPFYATSGGQICDIGSIENDKFESQVLNCTKTASGIYLHEIVINSGSLKIGDKVYASVDQLNRSLTACNHSSTHILHQALKDVLGNHISQKGSLVNSQKLRFDFSHTSSISDDDLFEIETIINNKIRDNTEVLIREMNINDSKKEGATALFGEKYGNLVRVVSMGDKLNEKKSFWSIELCGGTHVNKTGDIGFLKIINENSVSSGIRRIEAITGDAAVKLINDKYKIINSISQLLKTNENSIIEKITSLNNDKKKVEKELNNLKNKSLSSVDQSENIIKIRNIKFISKVLNNIPPNNLKGIVDNYLLKETNCVTALLSVDGKKISLVVGVTNDLSHKINAIDLVKIGSSIFGGKGGGGRPTMAQSGGSDIKATQKTIDGLIDYIKNLD